VPDIYLVMVGDKTTGQGLVLAETLRDALPGLSIQSNLNGGSFKSQFKRADRSGARLAMILGEEEVARHEVSIKSLRTAGDQQRVAMENLQSWLHSWLEIRQ